MTTDFATASTDTVRLARPGRPSTRPVARAARPTRPAVDGARLWTGGVATAAVAALTALVGVLITRVLMQVAPIAVHLPYPTEQATGLLCLTAAGAALAATGLVHLLLLSTPQPLAYFGWIIGLATTAATVLPLTTAPLGTAAIAAALHLVIGLAIGALVTGAAAAATRTPGADW